MLTAAPVLGTLLAIVFWRKKEFVLGNIAGTAVIFGFAIALVLRESSTLDAVTKRCLDAGYTCWPQPSAFTRYAIDASIGLVEVIALFLASLRVERRIRERGYAPEWRR
jgi:hypothetical protein